MTNEEFCIEAVTKLELEKGDILMVRIPEAVSKEQEKTLCNSIWELFNNRGILAIVYKGSQISEFSIIKKETLVAPPSAEE